MDRLLYASAYLLVRWMGERLHVVCIGWVTATASFDAGGGQRGGLLFKSHMRLARTDDTWLDALSQHRPAQLVG
jgi:hypothetical protein